MVPVSNVPAKKAVKKAAKKAPAKKTVKKAAKAVKKVARAVAPKKLPAPAAPIATSADGVPANWLTAARAADAKKATKIRVLDLREITSFADFFVICNGSNQRQIQAIANEVESELKKQGERANAVEGYGNAEWVLMDYGDLVVHIFSEQTRSYYDLDRLWREATEVPVKL